MALDYLNSGGPPSLPSAVPGGMGMAMSPAPATSPLSSAISPAPGSVPTPQPPPGPADMEYIAVTQSDGTVLLHVKNPDGTPGPAVKIVNAVKPGKPPGQ